MVVWNFIIDGGVFMWVLLGTSIIALAFIIERGVALRWSRVIPEVIEATVTNCRSPEDLSVLGKVCAQNPSPISRLLLIAQDHLAWPKAENIDAIQTRARKEVLRLERGLVIIEVIVGTAPLLGLVGTLHGLIKLFGNFTQAVGGNNQVLAEGISIALNTTLMGLLIAIPALIAWSYFNKKIEALAIEMETLCDEFLQRYYAIASGRN